LTRQATQPQAEEATWHEGEADEDTWQKGEGDDDIFYATVEREVDDHNDVQYIVEQEDDSGLEHENLQLTREQEQHNRIQRIYAYSERIHRIYMQIQREFRFCKAVTSPVREFKGHGELLELMEGREQPPFLQYENNLHMISSLCPHFSSTRTTSSRSS
jgi:hypothetical protein